MGAITSRLPRLRSMRMPKMPDWRMVRRRLIAAALVVAILAAVYMLWFRDSSLVAIKNVDVVGADTDASVASALEAAAQEQTTLHLDTDALRAAVADNPAVANLTASPDFPHGVTITVDLRQPVGYLDADGGTIVAGDGTVLQTGVDKPDGLAKIDADATTTGDKVDGDALVAAEVVGGVQPVLASQIDSVTVDPKLGPVVTLNGGVEVRFGDPSRADLKWKAVAAVLALPTTTTLNYLDVSVPSRPVSG